MIFFKLYNLTKISGMGRAKQLTPTNEVKSTHFDLKDCLQEKLHKDSIDLRV
jgi:hypothetical protein